MYNVSCLNAQYLKNAVLSESWIVLSIYYWSDENNWNYINRHRAIIEMKSDIYIMHNVLIMYVADLMATWINKLDTIIFKTYFEYVSMKL